MDSALTQEQTMLRDTVQRYLRDTYPFETRVARLRAGGGRDAALWNDFAAALGILGAGLPAAAGGMDGGAIETMIVMEALGEALVTEPYLETVVTAGGLLRLAGGDDHPLLARIVPGDAIVSFALTEAGSRYDPAWIAARATRMEASWRLDGAKIAVVAAPFADRMLVAARTSGEPGEREGLSLFLTGRDNAGITRHDYRLIDERPASDLHFVNTPAMLIGPEGGALPLIEQALDAAVAALCAEAVGVMRRMFDDTLAYVRERRQFGQPLGSFQVLQHRLVDMYMAIEQAVSASYLATLRLGSPAAERARAVSAAKFVVSDAIRFVGQNAVQLHGAMGMTEELAVGHYFRRATVIERQLGDADHHLRRYADVALKAAA